MNPTPPNYNIRQIYTFDGNTSLFSNDPLLYTTIKLRRIETFKTGFRKPGVQLGWGGERGGGLPCPILKFRKSALIL